MSTFADSLKSEIARVARKEMKAELLALRKTTIAHRSEIAGLKRDLKALASTLKQVQRERPPKVGAPLAPESSGRRPTSFNAEKFAALRTRLGVTQAQLAQMLGASALSVYKWESGKVHPRAAQSSRIAALMKLGKKEAMALLTA